MTAFHVGGERDRRRIRPTNDGLRKLGRGDRRAELVCSAAVRREGEKPYLLAVVLLRDLPLDQLWVEIEQQSGIRLGADFFVDCRCDAMHYIDGGKLRTKVDETTPPTLRLRNWPPRIEVSACLGVDPPLPPLPSEG